MTIGRTLPRNGIRPAPVGALAIAGAPVLQPGNLLANGDFSSNPGGWTFTYASIVGGALKWNVPTGSAENGDVPGEARHALVSNIPSGTNFRITLTRSSMLRRLKVYLINAGGGVLGGVGFPAGSGTSFLEGAVMGAGTMATSILLNTDDDGVDTYYQETGTIDDIIVQVYA